MTPEVQKAIFALLSLSSEYPDLMRDILKKIDSNYEKGEEHKLLQECIIDYPLPYSNQYLEHRLEQLKEDAQREFEYGQWNKATILPPNLTLRDLSHEIFNLIRSFSFVGEIGEDPEDYRYSGPLVDEPTAAVPAEATAKAPTEAKDPE